MTVTFPEVTYIAEGNCRICYATGETFDTGKSFEVCHACFLLVARARAGNGNPIANRGRPKGKTKVTAPFGIDDRGQPVPQPSETNESDGRGVSIDS